MSAYCKVPGCVWATGEPVEVISGCLATWHVYEQHRDVWKNVMGDRPPSDPDPRTPEGQGKIAEWIAGNLIRDLTGAP